MRNVFLVWLCSLFLLPFLISGYALADQLDKERIAEILSVHQSTLNAARVYHPKTSGPQTRSPAGARLYKRAVTGTVLVGTKSALGSGVRVAKGIVVTNWHVVAGQKYAGILFWRPHLNELSGLTSKDWVPALVLETDPVRDLAVLIVEPKQVPRNATIIKSARLSEVSVGQDVFAIGHPQRLFWSYTEGVVSQVRHNYTWKIEGDKHRATIIQTQTPISFGSSGGPLFNQKGHLIGLNTWGKAPGLYFAVAINEVNAFIFDVISRYNISRYKK